MRTYLVSTGDDAIYNQHTVSFAVSKKGPREVLEEITKKEPFFGNLTLVHDGISDAVGTCLARFIDFSTRHCKEVTKEIRIVVDEGVKTHVI